MNTQSWLVRPKIVQIVPEGKRGEAEVTHFTLKERDIALDRIRMAINGDGYAIPSPGRYAKLTTSAGIVMSDTDLEWRTNIRFLREADGRVLIGGLGLGFILPPLIAKPEVVSITVVELSADVIALVGPHFKSRKLTIVQGDIHNYRKQINGDKFDTIYFDIWADICTDNLPAMATLHRSFSSALNRKNPKATMASWSQDILKAKRRQERAMGW